MPYQISLNFFITIYCLNEFQVRDFIYLKSVNVINWRSFGVCNCTSSCKI